MIPIFILIVIIVTCIYLYYKISSDYWYYQHVFHIYDIKYYFMKNGTIISNNLLQINKYCNFKDIKTYILSDIDNNTLDDIMEFYVNNWMYQRNYRPSKETFMSYFQATPKESVFSIYYNDNNIVAIITSIPLNLTVNNIKYTVRYADNLCVIYDERNKGYAAQIIETHIYDLEKMTNNIIISFFEKFYKFSIVNPSCIFDVYQNTIKYLISHDNYDINIIKCDKTNITYLYDYIYKNNKFDVFIFQDINSLLSLIEMKTFYVYYTKINDIISSVYFFRRSSLYTDDSSMMEALYLIGSINYSNDTYFFIEGFKSALKKIYDMNNNYFMLTIKNISDNNIIIDKNMSFITTNAYYFKNIIIHNTNPNKFFCLN